MRLACQVFAALVAAWCLWLVASSPALTVDVVLSGSEETFEVACPSAIGGGPGSIDLSLGDGSVDRSWDITEGDGIYTAAVRQVDVDGQIVPDDGAIDGTIDGACDSRRDRRLAWAVLGAITVAGLLRVAVAFRPRPAPVPDRTPRRSSPLTPAD